MIKLFNRNLFVDLPSTHHAIMHGCNCFNSMGAGLAHGNVQTIMEVYQRISFQYADIYFKVYESHRGNYDLAINCLESKSIDLTLF